MRALVVSCGRETDEWRWEQETPVGGARRWPTCPLPPAPEPLPWQKPPRGRHLDHEARPVSDPPILLCSSSSVPPLPALKTKD